MTEARHRSDPDPADPVEHDPVPEPAPLDARSAWPRRLALLVLVVLVLVAAAFGTRFGTDPTVVDSPLIGQPAPDFTLPYLEQEGELALADLAGEVVVVNFWASWCTACWDEHDALLTAAARFRDDGVAFVGIVFQDRPEQATAFLDELGRGYPSVTDPGSRTAIDYGVFGLPETYFVDRSGTVVAKVVGESDLELLSSTIEAILAGRTPASVERGGYQRQPGG